jgi:hypothetical protein
MSARLRALWAHLTSQPGQRDIRLFVEVLGQSLFGETGYSPALSRSIAHRLDLIATNVVSLGCPEHEARAFATLLLATIRGLVIELLATGERERLDEAFAIAVENAERRAAEWASLEQPPAQALAT